MLSTFIYVYVPKHLALRIMHSQLQESAFWNISWTLLKMKLIFKLNFKV